MNKPRCPKCGSTNTIGSITCCSTDKTNNTKSGYFCNKCLIEFDEDVIRIYSVDGIWIANITY